MTEYTKIFSTPFDELVSLVLSTRRRVKPAVLGTLTVSSVVFEGQVPTTPLRRKWYHGETDVSPLTLDIPFVVYPIVPDTEIWRQAPHRDSGGDLVESMFDSGIFGTRKEARELIERIF